MAKIPQKVKDYTILPLVPPTASTFTINGPVHHFLYLRPHAPRVPTVETPRALFVANIPVDATLSHFRALFSEQLGGTRVERVDFESTPASSKRALGGEQTDWGEASRRHNRKRKRGAGDGQVKPNLPETWDRELHNAGSTAVVVFVDRVSMEQAFAAVKKAVKTARVINWGGEQVNEKLPALGSNRYKTHHALSYPSPVDLQSLVDSYMTAYSSREATLNRARARQRSVPDADGFITVTRGGRTGPARADEAKLKMEQMKEKEEKKRRDMEMGGFYRFQVREAKKREAKELIGRFEGDRRRVEELSQRRKRTRPE